MSEIVIDSSVLLAIFKHERHQDSMVDAIEGAVISTVNLAEVWTKLHEFDLIYTPQVDQLLRLLDRVEPFTLRQAQQAADLRLPTRKAGLSLGDRACLALALELDADVYTADRAWTRVDAGVRIHLIR